MNGLRGKTKRFFSAQVCQFSNLAYPLQFLCYCHEAASEYSTYTIPGIYFNFDEIMSKFDITGPCLQICSQQDYCVSSVSQVVGCHACKDEPPNQMARKRPVVGGNTTKLQKTLQNKSCCHY